MKDVEFVIIKDDDGVVSGFSLTGIETRAGCYCVSFVTAQKLGKGTIGFENGRIVFTHGGVMGEEAEEEAYGIYASSEGGIHEAEISPEDEEALKNLLNLTGPYAGKKLRVRLDMAWGTGFILSVQ